MEDKARRARPWLLLSPALATIFFLLVVPACFILVYSFWLRTATGADQAGFHLDNWREVLTDAFYRDILISTLRIAAITTVLCALAGYLPAYFIAMSESWHKTLLLLLVVLPFWISYIIRTMSWINILGSTGALNSLLIALGIINTPLDLLYNEGGVIWGLCISCCR